MHDVYYTLAAHAIFGAEQSIGIAHEALPGYVAHMAQKKTRRIPLLLEEDEMQAVDGWRFANKIASRNEAVRLLLKIALQAEKEKRAKE